MGASTLVSHGKIIFPQVQALEVKAAALKTERPRASPQFSVADPLARSPGP